MEVCGAYLRGVGRGGFVGARGDGQGLGGGRAGALRFGRLCRVPVGKDAVGEPHPPLLPCEGP